MKFKESMKIHLNYTKAKYLIMYLIAFALLWLGYVEFIVPIFGYSGFNWMPNRLKVAEGLLAIVFFALILPSRIKNLSDFLVHIHFLLPIVPMLVLYSAGDYPREYFYFVLMSFALVCLVRKMPIPKIKGNFFPMHMMMWGLSIVASIYIVSIVLNGGLQYINFNLLKVYEFRSFSAQNLPGIYGYFSPLISKVLLPIILILAVHQHKWLVVCLTIAESVIMFALTNHKGPLIYPIFVLCIYFVLNYKRNLIQLLLAGYALGILVSLVGFFIGDFGIILGSLIIRRGYFVPPLLNFYYYDFFSKNPHTILAQSKLTFGILDYPYDIDASHLIGYHYYNNELTGANTGWLGSAYMHFGFEGMLLYAFIIGLMLSMVDTLAERRDLAILGAIIFTPLLTLFLSSDLPTSMLTHGLILTIFLAWSCQLKASGRVRRYRTIASYFNWLKPITNHTEVIKAESGNK